MTDKFKNLFQILTGLTNADVKVEQKLEREHENIIEQIERQHKYGKRFLELYLRELSPLVAVQLQQAGFAVKSIQIESSCGYNSDAYDICYCDTCSGSGSSTKPGWRISWPEKK